VPRISPALGWTGLDFDAMDAPGTFRDKLFGHGARLIGQPSDRPR
jgi:hypothetical protein